MQCMCKSRKGLLTKTDTVLKVLLLCGRTADVILPGETMNIWEENTTVLGYCYGSLVVTFHT